MVARGRVENGVVVLDKGVRLPEGQEVTVLVPAYVPAAPANPSSPPRSVLDIPPVSVGRLLIPPDSGDDLLGEMLQGRS